MPEVGLSILEIAAKGLLEDTVGGLKLAEAGIVTSKFDILLV